MSAGSLPPYLQAKVDRLSAEAAELRPHLDRLMLWATEAQLVMREVDASGVNDDGTGEYDWQAAERVGIVPIIDLRGDLADLGWATDA